MAVIMINSVTQSLANNPYNVTPIQPTMKTRVTPTHQASSQSNSYSAEQQRTQQNAQAPSLRHPEKESEFQPSMSIDELEHKITTATQDKINDISADIQAQKQSIWQLGVQQHYVDSQKSSVKCLCCFSNEVKVLSKIMTVLSQNGSMKV